MNSFVFESLKTSYTAYHVIENSASHLQQNGFLPLSEREEWNLQTGKSYVVTRGGTALIAFTIGDLSSYRYKIVATHADSPALKLKYNPVQNAAGVQKLNVETYGGGIWSSFVDVPLAIAGRLVTQKNGKISSRVFTDEHIYIIPNVAIHLNRSVNSGYSYNAQTDLAPMFGMAATNDYFKTLVASDEELVGYDLFAVNKTQAFLAGAQNEFLCSGRIDNQVSAFASVEALLSQPKNGIAVAFIADNEEVGSRSQEGADSDFLQKTLRRINRALGYSDEQFDVAISKSFVVSADNSHAMHPNHPELSDPTNHVLLGGGVVIKQHANRNYSTTGLSAAAFAGLMQNSGIKTQNFFMRSDLACGSTLGVISATQISIPSVDIGVAQLAMHSSLETMAASDVDEYVAALSCFYQSDLVCTDEGFEF